MAKVRAYELRTKSKADLDAQVQDLKRELSQLRVAQVTGGAPSKLAKIGEVRKSIARVLTIINEQQRLNLRKFYEKKALKPTDLRSKLTRAKRQALTRSERNAKTNKQAKKLGAFPKRRFALKA
eukprot:TRINITY_DN4550_c0_g2_i1.p2 TRINITY_DN4550_c0_g2~~TRINITY_DN4550_c0_g2_i1.p2  ORF type:complete len:124 (-),score=38.12 TRINITY_DN4550_c0_g2_i1:63-434(-)